MIDQETRKRRRHMRIRGMRKKIYLLTYDKKRLNRKALRIRRSFDEVKKILERMT